MRVWGGLLGSIVGFLVLAACGGGSSSGGGGNPGGPTPPPAGGASANVSILGDRGRQSFTPNPVNVSAARTVTWQNSDGQVHRIMANDGSFDTGNIAPGATSQVITLASDGTNYHCTLHPGMIGSVNASSGTPPPCTGIYC
jgi:plastocyanin